MLRLVIGNKNYSSWSLRPWLALRQAAIPFEEEVVALDRPDTAERLARLSPSRRVPVLLDGDLVVWDSLAICEYAAERFPEKRLWPADARIRAVARSACAEMHSGVTALRERLPVNVRASRPDVRRPPEVEADVARLVQLWTDCRDRFGAGGPFLFGAFSIADAFFAPVVTRFRTYGVPLDGEAARWADALWSLPALQEWVAGARAEPEVVAKYENR
jgi:glutathione S-transferase